MEVLKNEIPESLLKPFPKNIIDTDYRGFNYVSPNHYRKALNEAFGTNWSFEILSVSKESIRDSKNQTHVEIIVHCKLTIYVKDDSGEIIKIEKHGIGGKKVTTNFSDAYKSAKSVALKNACVELGLGLDLYENEVEEEVIDNTENETVIGNTIHNEGIDENIVAASPFATNNHNNKVVSRNNKATDKQIKFAMQLIKKTNHPSFQEMSDEEISSYLDGLSKAEISKVIEKLRTAWGD